MKDTQKDSPDKYFILTRIVKETYQITAKSLADAKRADGNQISDPSSVVIIKETIKQSK